MSTVCLQCAEATLAGAKAAAVATVASAIPTVSPSHLVLCSLSEYCKITSLLLISILSHACSIQLASVRMLPWAKANINPTGQALIISTGTLQLNPQIQRACLQLKEINLLASLNVWKQIMSKRFAERQLNSACSRRHGLLHRGGQEDTLAGEAALVRERPRAPQEHLLPGHRPSPPGLLQALIGSQAH